MFYAAKEFRNMVDGDGRPTAPVVQVTALPDKENLDRLLAKGGARQLEYGDPLLDRIGDLGKFKSISLPIEEPEDVEEPEEPKELVVETPVIEPTTEAESEPETITTPSIARKRGRRRGK